MALHEAASALERLLAGKIFLTMYLRVPSSGQYNFSPFTPFPLPFPLLQRLVFFSQAAQMHGKTALIPHDTFHTQGIATPLYWRNLITGSLATKCLRHNWRYCQHSLLFLTQTHHRTHEQQHTERAPTVSLDTGIQVGYLVPFAYGN